MTDRIPTPVHIPTSLQAWVANGEKGEGRRVTIGGNYVELHAADWHHLERGEDAARLVLRAAAEAGYT